MSISLTDYQKLKVRVDKAKADADRAAGALERAEGELQEEYGCSSLEEAETLLKQLEVEEQAAEESYSDSLAEFEEKWGGYLEGGE